MFGLIPMQRSVNRLEKTQSAFGGYDHREGVGEGVIWDCMNTSADKYPLLTTRPRRRGCAQAETPNGMYGYDCLYWVDGGELMEDDRKVANLEDSPKLMCGFQNKICIWPDMVIYDRETRKLQYMEANKAGTVTFGDGTYAGEPAEANTIYFEGDLREEFRAGDGVTINIHGDEIEEEQTAVIREIGYDDQAQRTELRFYEGTWKKYVTADAQKWHVSVWRKVPDLQIVFEHNNRLWGAKGTTIYACALGDPTNWQRFDGLSTDAYELDIGGSERITGGTAYGGRPIFFKEREIIKIYGDDPESWRTSKIQGAGVEAGSEKSLAVAGDTLFYKSAEGIMAYSGGYPRNISAVFGDTRYCNAVAGSDGVRYYVDMGFPVKEGRDRFCYDTRWGTWHREESHGVVAWAWAGALYVMNKVGAIKRIGGGEVRPGFVVMPEEEMASWAEFGDWTDGTLHKKMPGKLLLRMQVESGAQVTIKIQYDSGEWTTVKIIEGEPFAPKRQYEVPVQLRRCDHYRLRIEGTLGEWGSWTLHSLAWVRSTGSVRK